MFVKADERNVSLAAKIVKEGGIVVYPTDTVYGLGCNPFNVAAVQKIKNIKRRSNNPLPILAYDIENVGRIAILNDRAKKIAKRIWPGPITLVISKRKSLPDSITSSLNSVGVRIPNNQIALRLIKLCGGLLVGTSANKSGASSPTTAIEANKQIGDKVDMVLDGGPTILEKESTVVSLIEDRFKILRAGAIGPEKVIQMLKSKD